MLEAKAVIIQAVEQMSIKGETATAAPALAEALGVKAELASAAIAKAHARHSPHRRNLVSTLSSTTELSSALRSMDDAVRVATLSHVSSDGRSWLQLALDGEISRAASLLSDLLAGPWDVAWDGNWPSARRRLRGRVPTSARPGDIVIGGDGGGVRIALEILADDDGTLTAEALPGRWRDPPFEDVFCATYRRLARLYPDEIPPDQRTATG